MEPKVAKMTDTVPPRDNWVNPESLAVENGWIRPDGVVFECPYGKHEVAAEQLIAEFLSVRFSTIAAACQLEKVGWIKISEGDILPASRPGEVTYCSDEQYRVINGYLHHRGCKDISPYEIRASGPRKMEWIGK